MVVQAKPATETTVTVTDGEPMAHFHDHPAIVLPSRRTAATGTSPTRATTPFGGLTVSTRVGPRMAGRTPAMRGGNSVVRGVRGRWSGWSGARSIGGAQRPHQSQGDGDRAGPAQQQFTWRGTAFGVAGLDRRADHCPRPDKIDASATAENPRRESEGKDRTASSRDRAVRTKTLTVGCHLLEASAG